MYKVVSNGTKTLTLKITPSENNLWDTTIDQNILPCHTKISNDEFFPNYGILECITDG